MGIILSKRSNIAHKVGNVLCFSLLFADKRTNHWPLLGSPIPGLTIIGLYLYFILSYGPRFMANRKPLNLRYVLIVYNFFQVGISVWLVWEVSGTIPSSNQLILLCFSLLNIFSSSIFTGISPDMGTVLMGRIVSAVHQ